MAQHDDPSQHDVARPTEQADGHSHYPPYTNLKAPFHCAECGAQITHEGYSPWRVAPLTPSQQDAFRAYMHGLNRQAAIAQGEDPDAICPLCGDVPDDLQAHLTAEHRVDDVPGACDHSWREGMTAQAWHAREYELSKGYRFEDHG